MNPNIEIQSITKDEWQRIYNLASIAFPATYDTILSPTQIDYMMEMMYSKESIINQIEEQNHRYFTLQYKNQDCGYLSIEQQRQSLFHLHKIYLLPSHQGLGLGRNLFLFAIEQVRHISSSYARMELNVNRHNTALDFYLKMGMKISSPGDSS